MEIAYKKTELGDMDGLYQHILVPDTAIVTVLCNDLLIHDAITGQEYMYLPKDRVQYYR